MSVSVGSIVKRNYTDFKGIDLLNTENSVDIRRSPDCKNVWKSYANTQSNLIETRPGLKELVNFNLEEKVNGMYIISADTAIVHIGTKLIKWVGFPNEIISQEILKTDMNDLESQFFYFKDFLYILDGKNYLKYDGINLINVEDEAYIPTTTISRSPSGGGEILEDINLLSDQRINTFVGDGKSVDYFLDAVGITSIDEVKINDVVTTAYTINLALGKITFNTAPVAPTIIGQSNVSVKFTKEVSGYKERIKNCIISIVFDDRVFFSCNENYKNAIFHCSLNNPAYISDLDYYECGSGKNKIKDIEVGNNVLYVIKEENQNKDTLYYLSPTIDSDYGKIYPTSQGNISTGCYVSAIKYKDNLLYLSKAGLEGLNGNIQYEQSLDHKSSFIDSKLINMNNYGLAKMEEYADYLLIAVENCIFLGDYRQSFRGINGIEYEWYFWEFPIIINYMKKYDNYLYIGDNSGKIYRLEGTNDLGKAIESYWTTPFDDFGYTNHLKKINKRGAILKAKNMQNGRLKIGGRTNKEPSWSLIKENSTKGFSYNSVAYDNFSYNSGNNFYIVFRFKRKKIIDVALKVYSDELDKPFGLQSITLEAFLGGYVKRS